MFYETTQNAEKMQLNTKSRVSEMSDMLKVIMCIAKLQDVLYSISYKCSESLF